MSETKRYNKEEAATAVELFKASVSLPKFSAPKGIDDIIATISNGNFTAKDPVQISEYAVKLEMYALYLTYETNKLEARLKWYESNIKHIVGKELKNSMGFTFQEKDADIRSNVELAALYEEEKLLVQHQLENFKKIAFKISSLVQVLESFAKNKSYQERS